MAAFAQLTTFQRQCFEENGYLVLKGVVSKAETERFLREAVEPAMREQGFPLFDFQPQLDPSGSTGGPIKAQDGGDHPIRGVDTRWPAFFESPVLRGALDDLHGGPESVVWDWDAGARKGVGWIHPRWPVAHDDNRWPPTNWRTLGWHTDGETHYISTRQSIVVLPVVTPISQGGGGTALIQGSHKKIANVLFTAKQTGEHLCKEAYRQVVDRLVQLTAETDIVETRGSAGDVLLMHPFLVHAGSDANYGHPVRITFNLATKFIPQHTSYPSCVRAVAACVRPSWIQMDEGHLALGPIFGLQNVATGHYLQVNGETNRVIGSYGNIKIDKNGWWRLLPYEGGTHTFRSVAAGKFLNLSAGSMADLATVHVWGDTAAAGGQDSRWHIVYEIDGTCGIKSQKSSRFLMLPPSPITLPQNPEARVFGTDLNPIPSNDPTCNSSKLPTNRWRLIPLLI
ncbi:hypothetical protein CYMTET_50278 [Cymbomonas tetramitiformis]|uniref:Ricin B lectin domain-containing protein n=1 Tax=Cymbomonas tetramitiformis TaxID=36881 RepID=A0AAE0BNJ1_9CHLO|nr:hypothetical protein CYMTET_50278 [Cymbomonas tetramitiformis]